MVKHWNRLPSRTGISILGDIKKPTVEVPEQPDTTLNLASSCFEQQLEPDDLQGSITK